ncbi:MAG TPA: folate-binding protein [Actinomycetes bacterium]|nr:folate-binding protein [Actinomycetes bacterium]
MNAPTSPLDALEAATERAVALDRPDLATIALGGTDLLRYLHAVCTQHTLGLVPGDATQALLLSPKGKIEFAFRLAVLSEGVLVDTETAAAPGLAERLARFVFRYDVTVARPVPGAAGLLGPGADDALARAGLPVPGAGPAALAGPELVVQRTPVGVDLVGPGAAVALAGLERAGLPRAPAELWEVVRVAAGLPRAGRELTDDVLAEEAGLLGSHVHLDKGCYPGQETVARVHNLGQVQRRLAGLRFEPGDGLPAPRTDLVTDDGRRAGQLRSVVDHPRLGPIGLAYVRRVVDDGRLVRAADRVAIVVDLPFS